jgi:predicted amidohydrolase
MIDNSLGVAAVQFSPALGDTPANLDYIERKALWVAANYAPLDVIVFPELALTGYELSRELAENLAVEREDLDLVFEDLTRETNCAIVVGFVERCTECGELHNSAGIWHPDGRVEVSRKWNLWGADYYWATSGTEHPHPSFTLMRSLDPPQGTAARLLICKDVRNEPPAWYVDEDHRFVEPGDARVTLCAAAWGNGEFPPGSWFNFVANSQSWLVVANRSGEEPNVKFQGGCMVLSPEGEMRHTQNPFADEDVLYTTIPIHETSWDQAHKAFPSAKTVHP